MIYALVFAALLIDKHVEPADLEGPAEVVVDRSLKDRSLNPARYNLGRKADGSKFSFPNLGAHALYESMCGEWEPVKSFLDGEAYNEDTEIANFTIKIAEHKFQYVENGEELDRLPFIEFHEKLNAIEIWNGNDEWFVGMNDEPLLLVYFYDRRNMKNMEPQQGNYVVYWSRRGK